MAKYAVHMVLREVGGERYLLCDTKGDNLYSTRAVTSVTCCRCLTRWNNLMRRHSDGLSVIHHLQELLDRKMAEG